MNSPYRLKILVLKKSNKLNGCKLKVSTQQGSLAYSSIAINVNRTTVIR